MNATEIKVNWIEIKDKLKQNYAELTEDDLLLAEGKQGELVVRLQEKLGKTKEQVHKIISNL
ncbi:general stress protein CsbD [Mariniflexile sp. AS56]|uniref:general stress protein CsbD n=1 Tax=Mariniflexile sp. AS56 TaxID=3063957 RepID=UPI0026E9AD17|nr:general stress protein CsbD [Mariniflexile sp. AS56]MDO7171932.1 general stress protein CsbD [Mariniflexile sp. AS56]